MRFESKDKVWGLWVLCPVTLVVSVPFGARISGSPAPPRCLGRLNLWQHALLDVGCAAQVRRFAGVLPDPRRGEAAATLGWRPLGSSRAVLGGLSRSWGCSGHRGAGAVPGDDPLGVTLLRTQTLSLGF